MIKFARYCDKALCELQHIHYKLECFNDSVHSQNYIVALCQDALQVSHQW